MENLDQEKKNKRTGAIITTAIHALLLLLFAFMIAWREPDPPLPEYGIEINFGLDNQGSGDIQPRTPQTTTEPEQDPAPEPPAESEESPVEEVQETEVEEVVEDIPETSESEAEPVVENTQDSPEVIEEKPKEEPVKEPKKEEVKKPEPKKETPKKETPKKETTPKPPVEAEKQPTSGADGKPNDTGAAPSQGDDVDKEGDKGSEQGQLDARALYGKAGGGNGGTSLKIVGWMWNEEPRDKDTSNENGTVTFEFLIDEDGYVIKITTLQRSVSPSVAKFYEEQLRQTTFSRTGSGVAKPGNTKGTVTFSIVSK